LLLLLVEEQEAGFLFECHLGESLLPLQTILQTLEQALLDCSLCCRLPSTAQEANRLLQAPLAHHHQRRLKLKSKQCNSRGSRRQQMLQEELK